MAWIVLWESAETGLNARVALTRPLCYCRLPYPSQYLSLKLQSQSHANHHGTQYWGHLFGLKTSSFISKWCLWLSFSCWFILDWKLSRKGLGHDVLVCTYGWVLWRILTQKLRKFSLVIKTGQKAEVGDTIGQRWLLNIHIRQLQSCFMDINRAFSQPPPNSSTTLGRCDW